MLLANWIEMKDWPSLWELDFGFAPIGAHRIEPSMIWCFNDKCMDGDSWSQREMHSIYNAQMAAALARFHRIGHVTIQIRGGDVWLHSDRGINKDFNSSLFKDYTLLIANLADAAEFVINANWIDPVAFRDDKAPNLQILLTKFDIN